MKMRKHLASTRLCATTFVTICMLSLVAFIGNAYAHKPPPAPVNKQSKQTTKPIKILIASAASNHQSYKSGALANLIDGNLKTRWELRHFPQEIILDLGIPQIISSARIAFDALQRKNDYRYTFSTSLDSINWLKVINNQKYATNLWTKLSFNPLNARYIKIGTTSAGHTDPASIHDIELYGQKSSVSNQGNQGQRKITLSWLPSPTSDIQGYLIYYGASTNSASIQVSDVLVNTPGFNSQAPSIQYDSWLDLNTSPGENVCFRVKAYNGLGLSKSSYPVCSGV